MPLTRRNAPARDDLGSFSPPGRAFLRRGLAVIGLLTCVLLESWTHAPEAHAQEDGRVLVVPLDSSVPAAQIDIVRAFDLALASSLQQEATNVTLAQTSLDDAMAIVGCSERSAACLRRVAEALAVDYIVFGRVVPAQEADAFEVTLVVARREGDGEPSEDRFSVRAAAVSEAGRAFVGAAPPRLLSPRPPPEESVAAPEAPSDTGGSYAFDFDRVERSSWIVAGSGGALFSMGVVFWLLASSSQSDIDSLVIDDVDDLERLVALEDRTRKRATMGNVLALTGTVTAAVGAVLAVRQGLVRKQPARIDVAPMATDGGVGVMLTIGWR